jgi:hypothetical protein
MPESAVPGDAVLLTEICALDAVLSRYSAVLAGDFEAYRNHAYRVANLCASQSSGAPEAIEKIAIAAAFHDLGIWTARTFDYLEPSASLARQYLVDAGRAGWAPEVTAAILEHHRVTAYRGAHAELVEAFRRADWMDVTGGLLASGLSRAFFRATVSRWPRAGFHRLLARLEWRRVRTHPWNPLPMVKL